MLDRAPQTAVAESAGNGRCSGGRRRSSGCRGAGTASWGINALDV